MFNKKIKSPYKKPCFCYIFITNIFCANISAQKREWKVEIKYLEFYTVYQLLIKKYPASFSVLSFVYTTTLESSFFE